MNPCLFIGGNSDGALIHIPPASPIIRQTGTGLHDGTPHDIYKSFTLNLGGEKRRVYIIEGMTPAQAFDHVALAFHQFST